MNSYFAPYPGYWLSVIALNGAVWLLTLRAPVRLQRHARAAVLSASVSPALIVAAGHSAAGYGWLPMLALIARSREAPALLMFAALNALPFFALWATLAWLFRRTGGTPAADANDD